MEFLALLDQITWILNLAVIALCISMETFWFIKEKKKARDLPGLVLGFFLYNIPFLILLLSMYLNDVEILWLAIVRLVTLLIFAGVSAWLHYHGDKGGNSVGMATIFFLIISVPMIIVQELCIWLL